MCPSSGEITVFMRHLVFVIPCGWLSGMHTWYLLFCVDDCLVCTLHTRQSSIRSKYKVSHRYSYFSSWWAHSRLKHVEKRNKHTKKNYEPSWLYLQDYTGMHRQRNIKLL